jgi:hypothetical protein
MPDGTGSTAPPRAISFGHNDEMTRLLKNMLDP